MRRSLFCLAAVLLTVGLAVRYGSRPSDLFVAAQEAPAAARPATDDPAANRFAIPDSAEVSTLVAFVKAVKEMRPELGPAFDEYEEKGPAAIRKACERILELERRDATAAAMFARRELLPFHMKDLAEAGETTDDQRRKLTTEAVTLLKASDRGPADAELATFLGTTFEEFAPAQESLTFYQSLGDLFARNTNESIARRGEYLLGAAHRLGILGKPFELTGETTQGESFDLKSLRGKVVLVQFWATWSGHCLDDIPNLRRNYQQYHDRGFEIVGISVDDDPEALQTFLKKQQLPWATLHNDEAGSEHPAAIRYGVASYPTTFLIDAKGRVIATDVRGRQLNRKLAELCGSGIERRIPYPTFHVGDVIDKLTTAGSKLHQAGKTVGDAELRKQMTRQSVELDLPPASDEPVSDRELYRRACESVFIVCSLYKVENSNDWQTSLATAFAVTKDGVLTSSCHVFDNDDQADAVVVMDIHRRVFPVRELLAVNQQSDTCLFKIDATNLEPLPFADDAPPGTRVRVLGHPGDSFYFLSSGLLANYEKDHEETVWMNITADFGQGSSGGPVLDECGNVVGQVSRTFTLYAGGPATRGQPRRVPVKSAGEKRERDPSEIIEPVVDVADPQMVFKSCVPVKTLRSLVKAGQETSSR